jgi:hypothetical protein
MTAEERQALREKHRQDDSYCFACAYWNEEVGDFHLAAYPCDVIKVLDATEPVSETDPKLPEMGVFASLANNETEPEKCDHMVYVNEGSPVLMHARLRLTYCPKCGEKL